MLSPPNHYKLSSMNYNRYTPLPPLVNPAKPRNCPPRLYRNSSDVIIEDRDNSKLDETQGGQQVAHKNSAVMPEKEPIKVDPEISMNQCRCKPLPPPPPPLPPPLPPLPPLPPPLPPPPVNPPKPCNCPPRAYRNPPDVILEAGDNIKLDETQGDQQVTYKISAIMPDKEPVKVDPEIMYGDGINTPLGVYVYDGDSPGLVPHAPAPDQDPKYLANDGTWTAFDQSVDAESGNAVTGKAVAAEINILNVKIDTLFDSITPVPISEASAIVNPLEPGDGEPEIPFD